jgi:endoglucanase
VRSAQAQRFRRTLALAFGAVVAVGGLTALAGTASAGAAAPQAGVGGTLYVDPGSNVVKWVAANLNDPREPVIADRIASQPQAHWLSNYDPATIAQDVTGYVGGAGDQLPVLSVYGIPNRDCGGASAGGAPDLASYQSWIGQIAGALGDHPVLIILETDSLALQTCLSGDEVTARDDALHQATLTLKGADPNAKVYLDGGHSAWNSAGEQASRLMAAGVTDADGVFTNVSNFNPTADEVAYGKQILAAIGDPDLHLIVDTSRNGNGSNGEWCDPDGRALGQNPTTTTDDDAVDAYLWVKLPGESDGCADPAGTFDPDLAYALATN